MGATLPGYLNTQDKILQILLGGYLLKVLGSHDITICYNARLLSVISLASIPYI